MSFRQADIVVVGNGIVADSISISLLWRDPKLRVVQVGPTRRIGSATLAAAAMLNSFAEVDQDTLGFPILKERFQFNRYANRKVWELFIRRLTEASGQIVHHGFGTFVINNSKSGTLEDNNFDAILKALELERESFEFVSPRDIPKYQPLGSVRALRAIYIPDEGWVNPVELLASLDYVLDGFDNFESIDGEALMLKSEGHRVLSVIADGGQEILTDRVVLANGASLTDLLVRSGLNDLLLRIYRGVGVTLVLETSEDTLTNCVRTPNRGLACGLYSAPRDESHTVVGATNAIWDEPRLNPTLNNVSSLLQNARTELNQNFDRAPIINWNVGWRPITEDLMPMIGETEISGLFVANGMRRDGFHCSPVIGEILASLLLGGDSKFQIGSFVPRRRPLHIFSREESVNRITDHTIAAAVEHGFEPGHVNQLNRIERAIRMEAERLHDSLGLSSAGIQPEFFSYFEGIRRRAESI